jgi:hypothetical protein
MERLIPKFRFGHIDPAAVEARRARRGPGYEFYQIAPTNIMLVSAVLGIKILPGEAIENAIPNYWNCVDAWRQKKSICLSLVGLLYPRMQANERFIKTSSGKNVSWQSSTWNVTLGASIRSFASASMPGEMSVATTLSALPSSTCV